MVKIVPAVLWCRDFDDGEGIRAGIGITVSTRSTVAPFADSSVVLVPLTASGQFVTWYGTYLASGNRSSIAREVVLALARTFNR